MEVKRQDTNSRTPRRLAISRHAFFFCCVNSGRAVKSYSSPLGGQSSNILGALKSDTAKIVFTWVTLEFFFFF